MDKEKRLWLESIGAKAFVNPVNYVYSFPGVSTFHVLSDEYVNETPLDDLKEMHRQNRENALAALQAKHERNPVFSDNEI